MRRSSILLFVLLLTASAHAQVMSDQITVNVVEVPVNVTRYNGEPLQGLTKDDFELFVNGRAHPIDYFDTVIASARQDAEERPELHRRRLFVLLFDDIGSSFISIHRAKQAAEKFVAEAPAGDAFAVAVTTRRGIMFAVPFTTDRVAVRRAIATLRESAAGDAFSLATLESERAHWDGSIMSASERSPSGDEGPWDPPGVQGSYSFAAANDALKQARVTEEEWLSVQHDRATRQLASLADRLAPISGIKHVVLLREAHVMSGWGERFEITRMHRKFRDAGVILDAIDIAGLRAPWGSEDSGLLKDPVASLRELTAETGGTVALTFDTLRRTQSLTYIVGFVPPADGKRDWNSIEVRVRNKPFGAYINHRRGYSMTPGEKVDDSLFLADVLLNDIPLNGLTVDLDVEHKDEAATLVAKVPGVELLSVGSNGTTMMDVFLYVFDEKGVVASWTQLRLNVDHAKGREFLEANPYTIRQRFRLGPGRYSAKALVQVVGTEAKGFQHASFEMPRS